VHIKISVNNGWCPDLGLFANSSPTLTLNMHCMLHAPSSGAMNRLAPVGSYLLEVLTEAHVDDLRSKGLLLKCSTVDQGMDLLPCRKIVNIQPTPRFARNLFEIIVRFISLVAVTSGKD
jgi:hypothetical protein